MRPDWRGHAAPGADILLLFDNERPSQHAGFLAILGMGAGSLGYKALAEALKLNTTLTTIDIS
eukprot:2395530-Pleurochrysis_carterae.AAC.1